MPMLKNVVAGLSLVALTACPAPPESGGDQPMGPGPGPAQPGAGAPGAPGEGMAQGGQDRGPAVDGRELTPTETAGLPLFDSLVDGGADTVTVTGTVSGVNRGRVDFQIAHKVGDWTVPRIVKSEEFSGGSFSVKVPVDYTVPVYVVVLNDTNGNGPDKDDPSIFYPEPISIGEADVSLEFAGGSEPEWVTSVFSVLPDPESGANIIKDGAPANAQVLNPDNPPPDGIDNFPPGTGGPTFDEGPRPREGDVPPEGEGAPPAPGEGQAPPPAEGAPPPSAP